MTEGYIYGAEKDFGPGWLAADCISIDGIHD